MTILIFGIDSLGYQSINFFKLKKLKARFSSGKAGNPKIISNSNHSRGWPEIYTGMNAYQSGAFYPLPMCNKGRIISFVRTGLSFIIDNIDPDLLLWEKLNDLGYICGIFNINTIDIPQPINGFFVPGTIAGKIDNDLNCYPQNLMTNLQLSALNLGLRMGYGAFIPNDLTALIKAVNDHISGFFYIIENLIERYRPEICFIHSPVLSELIFKFMKLFQLPHLTAYELDLKCAILELARNLDVMIDQFIAWCSPKHLFIVSDHGSCTLDFHLNINEILHRNNLINRKRRYTSSINYLIHNIYFYLKKIVRPPTFPGYDLERSILFNLPPSDLIYLNDERFTGPKISEAETQKKAQDAANRLNEFAYQNNLPIMFEVLNYPKIINLNKRTIPLPNIRCHMPDNYANTGRTYGKAVQENIVDYGPNFFKNGFWGDHAATYAMDTACLYQGNEGRLVCMDSLSTIYKSILKVASKC